LVWLGCQERERKEDGREEEEEVFAGRASRWRE
jgi:hypothetical protein